MVLEAQKNYSFLYTNSATFHTAEDSNTAHINSLNRNILSTQNPAVKHTHTHASTLF